MKVFTHNFNYNSNSGPNKFCRTLFAQLIRDGKASITNMQQDADVEFCLIQQQAHKVKPMLLRLDGIWFNSEQDYKQQNAPIRYAYKNADVVVFQSNFNKLLTESWFGEHKNSHVIHNAADLKLVKSSNKHFWDRKFGINTELWSCASNWRPHKRLKENIDYFNQYAPEDAQLAIAGNVDSIDITSLKLNKRIHFLGELDYMSLLSLYRKSSTFIHLAFLDHCPNVVVDAQACGCHVVCSSTGGTKEVVTKGTIVVEKEWDYTPIKLYQPPVIDFNNQVKKQSDNKSCIVKCSMKYYNLLGELM